MMGIYKSSFWKSLNGTKTDAFRVSAMHNNSKSMLRSNFVVSVATHLFIYRLNKRSDSARRGGGGRVGNEARAGGHGRNHLSQI